MKQQYTDLAFVFYGTSDSIARQQALVSNFRSANGMNPSPSGPLTGTPERIAQQKALIAEFRKQL